MALGGCGGSAGANAGDPVEVTKAYLSAIKSDPSNATYLVASEPTEKLIGSTNLSRFLAANKAATAKVINVNWIPPGGTTAASSDRECLVPAPQGGQICIVTVEVTGGKPTPVYFHVDLENRYKPGTWEITNIDAVDGKPDNLLPSGNQAHA